jgi:hypothetical protein
MRGKLRGRNGGVSAAFKLAVTRPNTLRRRHTQPMMDQPHCDKLYITAYRVTLMSNLKKYILHMQHRSILFLPQYINILAIRHQANIPPTTYHRFPYQILISSVSNSHLADTECHSRPNAVAQTRSRSTQDPVPHLRYLGDQSKNSSQL